MSKEVVIVFVHGINVTNQDYYVEMRDRLLAVLPRTARDHTVYRAVFWADIVRGREQEYLLYANQTAYFRPTRLHKLVVEGLGDASAYQKTEHRRNSAYYEIQARLTKELSDVANGEDDARPLVFIGHSLGCHIISTYAWDMHRSKPPLGTEAVSTDTEIAAGTPAAGYGAAAPSNPALSPLERLDTFAGLITMGTNQPLFTFTFGPHRVYPITRTDDPERFKPAFPGALLDDNVIAQARWLNFYSCNDPLGYPLKPLNDAYDNERLLSDVHTHSEGAILGRLLTGGMRQLVGVRAHTRYWTNRKVVRHSANLIQDIIFADEIAAKKVRKRSLIGGSPDTKPTQ